MGAFLFREMTKEEVSTAVAWAAREGWNPGLFLTRNVSTGPIRKVSSVRKETGGL